MKVADYVESLIASLAACGSIEPSTRDRYEYAARHIRDAFAGVALKDLTPRLVRDWEASMLASGLSTASVRKAHRLLKQALTEAVGDEEIGRNPMERVKPPKNVPKNPGKNVLRRAARESLLASLSACEPSRVTVAAEIALGTGLREGETCGLRWDDAELGSHLLWVRRSIGRDRGRVYVKGAKSDRVRSVAMSPRLAGELSRWRSALGNPPDHHYILGGESPARPDTLGKQWAKLASKLDVVGSEGRRVTFHDLRRTWATMAVAAGMDIKTVASNLGHANAALTLNTYASEDPDAKMRASMMLDDLLGW